MRKVLSRTVLLTFALTARAPMLRGQESPPPGRPAPQSVPPVISSRQIDRYDAIQVLQQRVKEHPKSLADWIILGELAQEVALDLPADQASRYYRMSRDAYEKALVLQPDQPGLKAALQFAKDHEAHSHRFEEARDRATQTYLDARRRDLAATQYTPSLPLYGAPLTPLATAPTTMTAVPGPPHPDSSLARNPTDQSAPPPAAPVLPRSLVQVPDRTAAAAIVAADPDAAITPAPRAELDSANYGTRQFYSSRYSTYQPYYAQGSPYTYQQYSSSYAYGPSGVVNSPGTLPITAQQLLPATCSQLRTDAGQSRAVNHARADNFVLERLLRRRLPCIDC